MKIIIDISSNLKIMNEQMNVLLSCEIDEIREAIKNGIQLPENCGKLIDSNKIKWYGCDWEKHCDEVNDNCSICKYANCNRIQIERDAIIM